MRVGAPGRTRTFDPWLRRSVATRPREFEQLTRSKESPIHNEGCEKQKGPPFARALAQGRMAAGKERDDDTHRKRPSTFCASATSRAARRDARVAAREEQGAFICRWIRRFWFTTLRFLCSSGELRQRHLLKVSNARELVTHLKSREPVVDEQATKEPVPTFRPSFKDESDRRTWHRGPAGRRLAADTSFSIHGSR